MISQTSKKNLSDFAAPFQSAVKGHLIRILQVAAYGDAVGKPCHLDAQRLNQLGNIHSGGLPLHCGVGGHDDLDVYKRQTKATVEIGLSRTIGTKWKTTGATPQGDTLSKIAAYFDVSVDYLLGNEQEKKPVTNKDDELIKAINERPLLKRFVENLVKMDDESIKAVSYTHLYTGIG